jgi:hypothetical protein
MSMSFNEAMQQLEYGRQRLAIHNELVDFLRRFVDSETRRTDQGINTVGCISQVVDQDLILDEIEHIETEHITPLIEAIEALENLQVVETKDVDEEEQAAQEKTAGKKARVKTKAGKNKKARCAVPRGVKQAG